MSSKPRGSTYGFACGSTELIKIQKIFLGVTAIFVYVTHVILRLGISALQRQDVCSQEKNTISHFLLGTVYAFIKIYIVGLLPIIALRKWLIQESIRRITVPSLIEELRDLLSKKRAYVVPLLYIMSALSIGSSYYDLIGESYGRTKRIILHPEDPEFWCPTHRKDNCKILLPMINEHYMIANVHNFTLGLWFGLYFLLRKKHMLMFHIVEPRHMLTLHKELLAIWNRKRHGLIRNVAVTALNFSAAFWVIKLMAWDTFFEYLPYFFPFQNTINHYWLRASWFDVQLFNRSIFCSIYIFMYWHTTNLLFEHFFTRIFSIIDVFMDPHAMLIDGLHAHQQPYYQQIAFLELWNISNFDQNRRKTMYADFNRKTPFDCDLHNNPTSAWAEISRVCMDFILGLARSAQDNIRAQQQRKVALRNKYELFKKLIEASRKQKNKVKKAKKNLEVGVTAETLKKDHEYWEMKLFEWFHPMTGSYPLFVRKMYCYTVVPFLKRSIERRTRDLCKDLGVTLYAIQALTTLTVKSLNEDEHGIVQNDISNVFGAIIDCLLSLERYVEEPPLDDWDIGDPFAMTPSKVLADPLIIINVLKDSLFELIEAFMPHMSYVRLNSNHYERIDKLIRERM
ncbi:15485_t:CDS:10 [Acaulospora morrowiae]|uniref:15485_t:CDS:1 n=1 Tax=Acaulospora morrowiae TaxID=94023 RepID=A0A9N9G626_9GLOM|nr:15485_t:CDS:10 [Acaulospora morrowiae]